MSTDDRDLDSAPQASPVPRAELSEDSGLCGGPGQISCSEANDLIQTYLDHLTDPVTGERVQEHLGDCPPCESEFVVYQRIIVSLERCRPSLPADTRQRLEQFCTDLCSGESDS